MKTPVISLWQPWSSWIAKVEKTIETRLHDRFKSLVGKRVAIHSSAKIDRSAMQIALAYRSPHQLYVINHEPGIICTAIVKEHRLLTLADSSAALIDCGDTRRYGLILTDIIPTTFIPIKGAQGIWYYEKELYHKDVNDTNHL